MFEGYLTNATAQTIVFIIASSSRHILLICT